MIVAAGGLVAASSIDDVHRDPPRARLRVALIAGFIALFVLSGMGNGSTYKMIPSIFAAKSRAMPDLGPQQQTPGPSGCPGR